MKSKNDIDTLIECLIKRQLSKPTKYHPTLHKYFNDDELQLIFAPSKDIVSYENTVQEIKRYSKEHKQTSIKEIIKTCKFMFPSFIAGLYDSEHGIEISTDLVEGKVIIEQDDNKKSVMLSKKELLDRLSK